MEWLGGYSGILEGSALHGEGIGLVAAHNTLNDTEIGPFAFLSTIEVNDLIAVVNKHDELKTFRVFASELQAPDDWETVAAVSGQEENTLVLITCENESAAGGCLNRRVIFAKPNL